MQDSAPATSTSNYCEYAPDARHAGRIVCFWTQHVTAQNANFVQPVFPDGCVDVIWRNEAEPVVVGAMTRGQEAPLEPNLRLAGLRLYPGQAQAAFGIPATELTDREIPLREILGRSAAVRPLSLEPAAHSRDTWQSAVRQCAGILDRRASFFVADGWLPLAIRWLARHPDGQIRRLAAEIGLSERHLHRRFSAAVGYGPKLLQRIVRFQRFLDLAGRPGAPGLALLAADLGYADQAHLHRECREFSGRSPSQLIADSHSALAMSDLFNTDRSA